MAVTPPGAAPVPKLHHVTCAILGRAPGRSATASIIDRLGAHDAGIPTTDLAAELRVRDGAARTDIDVVRVSGQK